MTRADSVHSTPLTNAPIDTRRRRFLTVAAFGSMVGAGTLAAAALTPNDVPQAVTMPTAGSTSPALRTAIDRLAEARAELEKAMEADAAANDLFEAWERSHPEPKSKRGKRRWIKQMAAYHREVTPASWHALMDAEQAFAAAQTAVAAHTIEQLLPALVELRRVWAIGTIRAGAYHDAHATTDEERYHRVPLPWADDVEAIREMSGARVAGCAMDILHGKMRTMARLVETAPVATVEGSGPRRWRRCMSVCQASPIMKAGSISGNTTSR
jgi:hypothetical protein